MICFVVVILSVFFNIFLIRLSVWFIVTLLGFTRSYDGNSTKEVTLNGTGKISQYEMLTKHNRTELETCLIVTSYASHDPPKNRTTRTFVEKLGQCKNKEERTHQLAIGKSDPWVTSVDSLTKASNAESVSMTWRHHHNSLHTLHLTFLYLWYY